MTLQIALALLSVAAYGQKPGEARGNPKDGQRYAWIPPGSFTMGCAPDDSNCDVDEKPAHRVTLTRGFWLGQTTVTVGAYRRFAAATRKPMPPERDNDGRKLNGAAGNDALPIVAVTWDEARDFCAWAGGRLPTEAEWEYAAQAGSEPGDLDEVAWYANNSGKESFNASLFRRDPAGYIRRLIENGNGPHPVAGKKPNAWGLYDMLGNVWQWMADWYSESYYKRGVNQDPQGPEAGEYRSLRGGSWFVVAGDVRTVLRYGRVPSNRNNDFGFRCVEAIQ